MKALIKFIVFYPDNYQGGSGSYFNHSAVIDLDDGLEMRDLKELIYEKINPKVMNDTEAWDNSKYIIQSIEIHY